MKISTLLVFTPLSCLVNASPPPVIEKREFNPAGNIAAIAQGIRTAVSQGDPTGVLDALRRLTPVRTRPTTPAEAAAALQAITNGTAAPPSTIFEYIANLEALNLIDSVESLLDFVNGIEKGQDSTTNVNRAPPDVIYPQKSACDASYSVDENTLRSAIYIPPTFTYGTIPPVILFPGTGNYGYETMSGNLIHLLTGSDFADPVWVNVPGRLLNDAQKNAEFAAYAINYISSITGGKNITILGWSQGNINTQWAFKYWPSTTRVTTNHIAVSPDYAGTIMANFLSLPGEPLPPSILQQRYLQSSDFITTLRACDGDSAYVPTTTIYSGFFDEIVEPQQGTGASAFLKDARGVGVTNNQVQLVCPGQPAGSFYTHEGVLYNPLTYFLLKDAMANGGPGDVRRLDLPSVCATYLTPGLDLGDLLVTENALAIAGLAILTYPSPVFTEPAISPYATSCSTSTCPVSTTTSIVTSTTSSSTTSSKPTSLITTTTTSLSSTTISSMTSTGSSGTTSLTTGTYSFSTTTVTSSSTTSASSSQSQSSQPTSSLVSSTTPSASTTSSTNNVWDSWSPITTTTSSSSEPDKPESWSNWQPATSPTVQTITKTWGPVTSIYTSDMTGTVSSDSSPEWNPWAKHTPTTAAADWTIWDTDSRPTDHAHTSEWDKSIGTGNNNSVQPSASESGNRGSGSWFNSPASPTLGADTSSSAKGGDQWTVMTGYHPTTTAHTENWAGWSSSNGVTTSTQGSAGGSSTVVVAQWKGAAVRSVVCHFGGVVLALTAGLVWLVVV